MQLRAPLKEAMDDKWYSPKPFNFVYRLINTESSNPDYENLSEKILSLDKSIRFCAVTNKLGYIIKSQYRKNLKPLMTIDDTEKYALFATIRNSTRQAWESKIGKVQYSLTRYELLARVTVPLANNHLLLLSFDVDTKDIDSIMMHTVMPIINKSLL